MIPQARGMGGLERDEEDDTFDENYPLRNASPLRCASTPSVVEDNSLEGHGVTVEVEVGLKVFGDKSLEDNSQTAASQASLGDVGSYRTMSSTERKSVQSLLGTGTKSLADQMHDDEEEDWSGESDIEEEEEKSPDDVASLHWNVNNQTPMQQQVPFPHLPVSHYVSSRNGDDGYSADRSTSYTLENANGIDEFSTSANSYFELRQALPMGDDDTITENSHHHHYNGYGHTYNQEPLPRPIVYSKPVIPPTFPSLMDSSVSSALTASTAPSSYVVGGGGVMNKRGGHAMEKEEREDSLPPITARDPSGIVVLHQQRDAVNTTVSQQGGVGVHDDPLMSTSPSMQLSSASPANDIFTPFVHHIPPPSAIIDPRMNVDYERHYIVDLERINEESSGHHDLSSHGRKYGGASGSVSSPRTSSVGSPRASSVSSPRKSSLSSPRAAARSNDNGVGPSRATAASANAHNNSGITTDFEGRGNPTAIPEAYAGQQQSQLLSKPPDQHGQFYNYRHQYYMEQYHYCDEPFTEPTNNDEVDSTCSSVTLSQAFQYSGDGTDSCSSSITEDYPESHMSPSMVSTVSSVTLSRALSVDKHEHSGQGFFVATRLGDFVEVPSEPDDVDEPAFFKTVYEVDDEEVSIEVEKNDVDHSDTTDTMSDIKSGGGDTTTIEDLSDKSTITDDETDAVSDITAIGSTKSGGSINNEPKNAIKIASTTEDVGSDILSALVPECGVPIPSVMAKVGSRRASSRSKGGMLLPWHSTRSIQNYQGRRGGKKKGSNLYSTRSRELNIFSIGSVHSFRG